uniref:Uncharacterized protein n=1 Tax=Arundo donax TaxID=35708 RepID=A0A0A9BVD5_ARUDO
MASYKYVCPEQI